MQAIKVVQFGFGSLGKEIFKTISNNKKYKVVGIVDYDKNKVGKHVKNFVRNKTNLKIVKTIHEIRPKPDIVLHATSSSINEAYPQFYKIANKGISIISTCEELVYPHGKNKKIANKIDKLAKRNQIQILGIGVNPGFLMDSLVLAMTSLCSNIKKIKVKRVVNLGKRRKALQKKMGVNLSINEFKLMKNVGHVGIDASAHMICDSLKVKAEIKNTIHPIIAKKTLRSSGISVRTGKIKGIHHSLSGKIRNRPFLEMSLDMFVGAKEYDEIDIIGIPPVHIRTKGIHGDKATIALLLNYIPVVLRQKSGLHTVNKLPFSSFMK